MWKASVFGTMTRNKRVKSQQAKVIQMLHNPKVFRMTLDRLLGVLLLNQWNIPTECLCKPGASFHTRENMLTLWFNGAWGHMVSVTLLGRGISLCWKLNRAKVTHVVLRANPDHQDSEELSYAAPLFKCQNTLLKGELNAVWMTPVGEANRKPVPSFSWTEP